MVERRTGTREWSDHSLNLIVGCPHRCRYCYAREGAVRRKTCPNNEAWGTTYYRPNKSGLRPFRIKYGGPAGQVMFPTTHDITPEFLDLCCEGMRTAIDAGNNLLIVSKPHLDCIREICSQFANSKNKIMFRFTIGALDDRILGYWEPGAPNVEERLESLRTAYDRGFRTSVSVEPMLDSDNVVDMFHKLKNFVTDTIWIGKMNHIRRDDGSLWRVSPNTDPDEIRRIEEGQTDDKIKAIYEALKNEPKVEWKDSIREVLGMPGIEKPR
jgi:DNA repair photolyase